MKNIIKSVQFSDGSTKKKPELSNDAVSAIFKIIKEDLAKSADGKPVSSFNIGATTIMV
jgi:hypothetical protein